VAGTIPFELGHLANIDVPDAVAGKSQSTRMSVCMQERRRPLRRKRDGGRNSERRESERATRDRGRETDIQTPPHKQSERARERDKEDTQTNKQTDRQTEERRKRARDKSQLWYVTACSHLFAMLIRVTAPAAAALADALASAPAADDAWTARASAVLTEERYSEIVHAGGARLGQSAAVQFWLGGLTSVPVVGNVAAEIHVDWNDRGLRSRWWFAVQRCEALPALEQLSQLDLPSCGIRGECRRERDLPAPTGRACVSCGCVGARALVLVFLSASAARATD
jgi:hypothetical protein